MLGDQTERLAVRLVGESRLLLIAHALRLFGERVVVGPHRPRDGAVAHAVLEHHRTCEVGHLLEVVRGTVRHPPEHDLLCRAAGQRHDHPVDELLLRVEIALLLRQVERVAERGSPRDDRRLLHR